MNDTDASLMVAFRNGDADAFAELVRRHQRPVLNFFFKLVWDSHLAEDMAQEVFLRIFRHAANYEETAKFTTFLYTIARNLWIDHVRAHTVEPRAASLDASPNDGESPLSDCLPASARTRPDRMAELAELDAQLRAALDSLPEDHRLVVVFSEVCGMRYQEIATLMKIPVGTVKSRMHTAVFQLRQLLSKKTRTGDHFTRR